MTWANEPEEEEVEDGGLLPPPCWLSHPPTIPPASTVFSPLQPFSNLASGALDVLEPVQCSSVAAKKGGGG